LKPIPHKWRKLSIEKRLDIPSNYFDLDKGVINKIRNIPNKEKRLIEAARIQYETFKDIHTDLTAWIAGFASDSVIRHKFGSSKNLREIFIKLPIKNTKIVPSWSDIKRNIKIPEEMTGDLAEETGIHIGDGNLYAIDKCNYKYTITGDLTNEYIYHFEHVKPLINRLYNCKGRFRLIEKKNCIESVYKSKAVVQFKNKILSLPIGSKKDLRIPGSILRNDEFSKRCIVGITDTDFSVTSSLSITGKLTSLYVVKEMHNMLIKYGIPCTCKFYTDYGRFHIQKEGALKIFREWGLKNKKHTSKFMLMEEYAKYLPYTTTNERLAVLRGKLNIENLERVSEKRKASVKAWSLTLPVIS